MKKQKTFWADNQATEWLWTLSKCFHITKATITKKVVQFRAFGRIEPKERWEVEVIYR